MINKKILFWNGKVSGLIRGCHMKVFSPLIDVSI